MNQSLKRESSLGSILIDITYRGGIKLFTPETRMRFTGTRYRRLRSGAAYHLKAALYCLRDLDRLCENTFVVILATTKQTLQGAYTIVKTF